MKTENVTDVSKADIMDILYCPPQPIGLDFNASSGIYTATYRFTMKEPIFGYGKTDFPGDDIFYADIKVKNEVCPFCRKIFEPKEVENG